MTSPTAHRPLADVLSPREEKHISVIAGMVIRAGMIHYLAMPYISRYRGQYTKHITIQTTIVYRCERLKQVDVHKCLCSHGQVNNDCSRDISHRNYDVDIVKFVHRLYLHNIHILLDTLSIHSLLQKGGANTVLLTGSRESQRIAIRILCTVCVSCVYRVCTVRCVPRFTGAPVYCSVINDGSQDGW